MRGAGGPWPDASQLLLLRAALGEGDAARDAWARWRAAGHVIELMDDGSYGLLPQLYRNLDRLGVDDPVLAKLRGIYRYSWYRNRLLFHAVAPLLHVLAESDVPVMVLKGAALATLYPGGIGARPMDDVDLLVRDKDVPVAVEVLREAGFEDVSRSGFDIARLTHHSAPFRHPDSNEIDLHWRPFDQAREGESIWAAAVQSELGGAQVVVPSAADQLLHACVHGVAICPAPMRWVADAMLVVRAAADRLDWAALVETARRHEVTVAVRDALTFLRDEMSIGVPAGPLAALARSRTSISERVTHRVAARQVQLRHGAGYVELWDRYRRIASSRGRRAHPPGFLHYLSQVWGLPGPRATVPRLVRKAGQIVRYGYSDPVGAPLRARRSADH